MIANIVYQYNKLLNNKQRLKKLLKKGIKKKIKVKIIKILVENIIIKKNYWMKIKD